MYKGHKIAVVMPVYNEESHVAAAVGRIPGYVDQIIVVDDGSSDATWDRLGRVRRSALVLLRHDCNRGVGAATKTGYRRALADRADLVAVMDGDGQMDGDDLPALLDGAIEGGDYVKGNRFRHPTIAAMPFVRWIGNRVFSRLTASACGLNDLDAQCGFTVFRGSALRVLELERFYDRYGFLNDLLLASARAGLRIRSIPVRCIYGKEVSGINPVTVVPTILYLILRGYLRRFSTRPALVPAFTRGMASLQRNEGAAE
jgi:glycosyltransferase involved in cell wall biosynthesis